MNIKEILKEKVCHAWEVLAPPNTEIWQNFLFSEHHDDPQNTSMEKTSFMQEDQQETQHPWHIQVERWEKTNKGGGDNMCIRRGLKLV